MERLNLSKEVLENAIGVHRNLEKIEPLNPMDEVAVQAMEELLKYRDAEEQGLLLQLPCKVDDMVWINDFGKLCAYRITGYSFGVAEDYINEPISETELIFYYENLSMAGSFAMSAIGKSVFLTKEEAEQALKQMGE